MTDDQASAGSGSANRAGSSSDPSSKAPLQPSTKADEIDAPAGPSLVVSDGPANGMVAEETALAGVGDADIEPDASPAKGSASAGGARIAVANDSTTGTVMADGGNGRGGTGNGRRGSLPTPESPPVCPPDESKIGGFTASLLANAVVILSLATAITVGLYVVTLPETDDAALTRFREWWDDWNHVGAPIVGIVIAVIAGAMFSRGGRRTSPAVVDPQSHGEIEDRWDGLTARIAVLCPPEGPIVGEAARIEGDDAPWGAACRAACMEARRERDYIYCALRSTGARWVAGSGYIDLWRRLHVAEEALLLVEPREEVIGGALLDEMRLKGSRIENNEDFLAKLHQAVSVIDPASTLYLTPRTSSSVDQGNQTTPARTGSETTGSPAQARIVLRNIRRAINGYRDDRRDALVRARNKLVWTGTFTGVEAFTLLVLAVLVQVGPETIVAAVVFYLIGAVVGLFNQLRRDSRTTTAVDDFGLARTRLFYTPLLSGLAGIGGVLVTALLYGALNGPIISYPAEAFETTPTPTAPVSGLATPVATPVVGTSPEDAEDGTGGADGAADDDEDEDRDVTAIPALDDVFDLNANRSGLLLAAIFGLTPDLLVDRLQNRANRYKADLQSSTAQERGGRETPE